MDKWIDSEVQTPSLYFQRINADFNAVMSLQLSYWQCKCEQKKGPGRCVVLGGLPQMVVPLSPKNCLVRKGLMFNRLWFNTLISLTDQFNMVMF